MAEIKQDRTWREVAFSFGCVAAVITLASAICSWASPFPLLADARGDLSLNPLEDRVLIAGLFSAIATVVLGALGKGKGRAVLILLGPILLIGSLLGWLGNHR
jgi:hypothetical protein